MGPQHVSMMTDKPQFRNLEYKKFWQNLDNLRKAEKALIYKGIVDNKALAHDQRLHPIQRIDPPNFSYPCWGGSEAERLLKLDVDKEKHSCLPPQELQKTKEQYQAVPLEVSRKHIHQEVQS
jgi:hypothetical protein